MILLYVTKDLRLVVDPSAGIGLVLLSNRRFG